MSFATPNSHRASNLPRSGSSLRRSGSFISLTDLQGANSPLLISPYADSMNRFIDTHEKRFRLSYETAPRRATQPSPAPIKCAARERDPYHTRTSSPLTPAPQSPPPRQSFPRSKGEPDLYKVAITTRMRSSREGQQILQMGSHLAVQIMNATRELEGIVAAQQRDGDVDVVMGDVHLSSSWLVVCSEDWEMVDC